MFPKKFHFNKYVSPYIRRISTGKSGFLEADESKTLTKFYHKSNMILAVVTPFAFIISPSILNMPIDLGLGILFPLHSHIGLSALITDYVPKTMRSVARASLLACTVITAAGLLRLNLTGAGLTETIKSLWRKNNIAETKK